MPPSRFRLLTVVFITTITGITVNTLIGPAIPNIIDEFGASDAAAGWIVASGSLPGIVIAPAVGFLADRYGRREVLQICLIIFAIAGGAGGLASSLPMLVGFRLVQGIGSAGLVNLAVVVIGDSFSGPERVRMIGRNSAVLTACLAVFPLLGGLITAQFGWRAVFAVYPLAILTAVLVHSTLPRGTRSDNDIASQFREVLPIVRTRRFMSALGATILVFALIFGALLTLTPVYLERVFGVDEATRGLLLGLPALGAMLGAMSTGRLSERHGRRRVATIAAPLFTLAFVGMAMAPSLPLLVGSIALFGVGEGLAIPLLQDLAASAGGPRQRGSLVATQVGMARFGQTIGPLTLSPLSTGIGTPSTYAVSAGIALGPLTWLLLRATSADRVPSTSEAVDEASQPAAR